MVVYGLDEKFGIETVKLMVNRGFYELVYLSGGIEDFGNEFPELIEGSNPPVFDKNPYSKFMRK